MEVENKVWVLTKGGLSEFEAGGKLLKHYPLEDRLPEGWKISGGFALDLNQEAFILTKKEKGAQASVKTLHKTVIFDANTNGKRIKLILPLISLRILPFN